MWGDFSMSRCGGRGMWIRLGGEWINLSLVSLIGAEHEGDSVVVSISFGETTFKCRVCRERWKRFLRYMEREYLEHDVDEDIE